MSDLTVSFGNLTEEEANELIEFRAAQKRGHTPTTATDKDFSAFQEAVARPTPAPDPAPAAVPSTGAPAATVQPALAAAAGMMRDSRGVPFHEAHHAGSAKDAKTNKDGSWRRRKNTDEATVKAYEARFLGNQEAVVSEPAPTPPAAASDRPNAARSAPQAVTASAAPSPRPAPPPGTPSMDDLQWLWMDLQARGLVTPELLAWVLEFGSLPSDAIKTNVFATDPVARKEAYDAFLYYAKEDAA